METPAQKDCKVIARLQEVAVINVRRVGGVVSASIKAPAIHDHLLGTLSPTARTGRTPTAGLLGIPELLVYPGLQNNAILSLCGIGSLNDNDGNFYRLRPQLNSSTPLVSLSDSVYQVNVMPLISQNMKDGTPFTIPGMTTTRMLRAMVTGWRQFIDNIHREYGRDLTIGAKSYVEEFVLPAPLAFDEVIK